MAWSKPPQSLIDLFGVCLPDLPGVARRRMFGFPAAFVNGNMFAGVFQDEIFARLPPEAAARLVEDYAAAPFAPMPGRSMKAYWVIPEALMDDEEAIADLLGLACRFTAALPPKAPKERKARTTRA